MTGADPKMAIHENIPMITDEEIDGVLSAIATQPRAEWGMFAAMLGMDGAKITVHKASNVRGLFA